MLSNNAFIQKVLKKSTTLPPIATPPRYPIVLCHGAGGDRFFLPYFLGIKEDLESENIKVIKPQVFRYASVFQRAEQLHANLILACEQFKTDKVNIVAHSMGGLDARYAITHLKAHRFVASLTTVATPHRGSSYADWFIEKVDKNNVTSKILVFLSGETSAYRSLTKRFMEEVFNPTTPDHPNVKYFSYAAAKKVSFPHFLYFPSRIVTRCEGENDGLVSVSSAKWGEFLGVLPLNHAEQINWGINYDARILYRNIVNILGERGF
jgi:triacylglycerol lipase